MTLEHLARTIAKARHGTDLYWKSYEATAKGGRRKVMDVREYVDGLKAARSGVRRALREVGLAPKLGRPKGTGAPTERDLAILADARSGRSFADIARENGITRERARQIVIRLGGMPKRAR